MHTGQTMIIGICMYVYVLMYKNTLHVSPSKQFVHNLFQLILLQYFNVTGISLYTNSKIRKNDELYDICWIKSFTCTTP